jgi:predicted transcriptional regulator
MAKIKQREIAQKLRIDGVSISDIATKLHISKSTVSLWCRDIVLTPEAIQNIVQNSQYKSTASILKYTEGLRIKRQLNVKSDMQAGAQLLGSLSERDILCVGLGLYWGEGYKQGNQEFGFTNSDPKMIQFYIHWLRTVFKVVTTDLILRVSINESHKKRVTEVEEFWSQVTGVPQGQFTKTSLIKTKVRKIYSNPENHNGTLRIKVRKGTSMRRTVLGALDALKENIC